MPSTLPVETLDFDKTGLDGWTTVEGQWAVEDMPGAPSGNVTHWAENKGTAKVVLVGADIVKP